MLFSGKGLDFIIVWILIFFVLQQVLKQTYYPLYGFFPLRPGFEAPVSAEPLQITGKLSALLKLVAAVLADRNKLYIFALE